MNQWNVLAILCSFLLSLFNAIAGTRLLGDVRLHWLSAGAFFAMALRQIYLSVNKYNKSLKPRKTHLRLANLRVWREWKQEVEKDYWQ